MYCSTCGKKVNQDLSYCNQCGARLGADEAEGAELPQSSFNLLVMGLIFLPVIGIGAIIGLLAAMKRGLNFDNDMIGIVTLLCFVLLLTAEAALIWLLLHRSGAVRKKSRVKSKAREIEIKSLNEAQPRGLSEAVFEPVPSVVENTTRNLQSVRREPRS